MFIEQQCIDDVSRKQLMEQGFKQIYTDTGSILLREKVEPYEVCIPMIKEFALHLRLRDDHVEYHGRVKKGFWFSAFSESLNMINEYRAKKLKAEMKNKKYKYG